MAGVELAVVLGLTEMDPVGGAIANAGFVEGRAFDGNRISYAAGLATRYEIL